MFTLQKNGPNYHRKWNSDRRMCFVQAMAANSTKCGIFGKPLAMALKESPLLCKVTLRRSRRGQCAIEFRCVSSCHGTIDIPAGNMLEPDHFHAPYAVTSFRLRKSVSYRCLRLVSESMRGVEHKNGVSFEISA